MPYALWKRIGGVTGIDKYQVDGMPPFPCNVAVYVTEEEAKIAKHLIGVIVFDEVERVEDEMKRFSETHSFKETKKDKK